jgi:NADPH:quinone reductase-like Zn-dependent oxidoreductase
MAQDPKKKRTKSAAAKDAPRPAARLAGAPAMRVFVVREHGGTDVLVEEERPIPEPAPDEVVVAVKACALNYLDLWVRRGVPGYQFPLPLVPGSDVAGVVHRVGTAVPGIRPGDRVAVAPGVSCGGCTGCLTGRDHLCAQYGLLGETRDGGYADYVAVPARNMLPLPASLSFEEGAAIPLSHLTAWHMLVDRAQLRIGETVLVHAAGSGVGSAAIQIAKIWGAKVIATVGNREKMRRARLLGADDVINYRQSDFADEVRKLTDKRGVDVVFEHVGAATFAGSMRCLARGGRLVTCGATTGYDAKLDLRHVFFKGLSILGSTLGSKAELDELWRFVEQGRLKPVVDTVLPLSRIGEAHRLLEERKAFGKVVVTP